MNQLFIPIERVLLETVFQPGEKERYALLQPEGGTSPLRVRFSELQRRLSRRFSPELSPEVVVERIGKMIGEQLLVTVNLDRDGQRRWDVSIRQKHAYESGPPAHLDEQRRSPRFRPEAPTDIKLELGTSSIEGTIYNVSEHGLGMALHTTALEQLGPFKLDEQVEVVDGDKRYRGRIRSQYPAEGGCVLGVELQERLRVPGLPDIEA